MREFAIQTELWLPRPRCEVFPFFAEARNLETLTPHECVHWDGVTLHFTPGVPRRAAPDEDALDDLWRGYYRSIFNPAR